MEAKYQHRATHEQVKVISKLKVDASTTVTFQTIDGAILNMGLNSFKKQFFFISGTRL